MPDNNNEEIIADFNIETTNIEGDCEVNTGDKFEFNIDINATPERTSQLINDGDGESPFVTENELQAQLPEKTSQLINDGDGEKPFITENNIQTPENSVIELIKDNNIITIKSTTFIFEQGIASDTWEIQHNLGKKPTIDVVDSADNVIAIFKKQYRGLDRVILSFNGSFKGTAYLN